MNRNIETLKKITLNKIHFYKCSVFFILAMSVLFLSSCSSYFVTDIYNFFDTDRRKMYEKMTAKERAVSIIDSTSAKRIISSLASKRMNGRKAGTLGGLKAGNYIISKLQRLRFASLYASYPQSFNVCVSTKKDSLGKKVDVYKMYSDTLLIRDCKRQLVLRNIIAKIDGVRSNEVVIIGAHYDHLGVGNAVNGDSIYNGADDNASGVSAVLQIAKAFQAMNTQPLRTVIFALWDGEEEGCFGSRYFAEHYSKIDKVRAYLNFDMIGRNNDNDNSKDNHVVFFYTEKNKAFERWLSTNIKDFNLNLAPEYRPWDKPISGSDNSTFAKLNIPIAWFHTNGHPDYHKPSDTADKINYGKVVDITKAAFLLMWHFANDENL